MNYIAVLLVITPFLVSKQTHFSYEKHSWKKIPYTIYMQDNEIYMGECLNCSFQSTSFPSRDDACDKMKAHISENHCPIITKKPFNQAKKCFPPSLRSFTSQHAPRVKINGRHHSIVIKEEPTPYYCLLEDPFPLLTPVSCNTTEDPEDIFSFSLSHAPTRNFDVSHSIPAYYNNVISYIIHTSPDAFAKYECAHLQCKRQFHTFEKFASHAHEHIQELIVPLDTYDFLHE